MSETGDKVCEHFEVTIVGAHGLKASDSNGSCDPYVKFGASSGKWHGKHFHTPTVKQSLSPSWDHKQELKVQHQHWLRFEVWDKDKFQDDFVGITTFDPHSHKEEWNADTIKKSLKVTDEEGAECGVLHIELKRCHK